MTEVRTRVLVSIFLIPFALCALYFGGILLALLFGVVASIGSFEYIVMMRKADIRIPYFWMAVSVACYAFLVSNHLYDLPIIWLVFLVASIESLVSWNQKSSIPRMMASFLGIMYTSFLPAMITRIELQNPDKKILLALILMIWIVDTSAYFFGMSFGKRRNITAVSPRKSLVGFVAGGLAPFVIVVILYLFRFSLLPMRQLLLIAFAAGIFGQIGDLVESMLKRFCGVKDSSNLIPGHGGVLDRSDSILLAGSFLYCALIF